ncbi:MAG TPA: adenylyltransferase/cytidyltransferase family protein [Fluviicola sp.]|nr:adenylyltransferase/cytidyltransferase family protein [Fluviicola sp.]
MSRFTNMIAKMQDLETAKATVAAWKAAGEKVVFTNGCFDILHRGHVTYLAHAADFGTKLVVALNTDASVKRLGKGDDRPVNSEDARSYVMSALGFVDLVVLFDNDTPLEVITALEPSVLVKGGDYNAAETDRSSKQYIVGSHEVRAAGGEVKTVDLVDGFSTTSIIKKLKKDA